MSMIVRSLDEHRAYLVGRQSGLRGSNNAVEQLVEQLMLARVELQDARVEYANKIAATRAHFDSEVASMRQELAASLAELDQLRLTMFQAWRRQPNDALN